MGNEKPELKSIAIAAIVLSLIALLSAIAFAIPNSLTLQGKLTNIAGASQQGTFNFTFKIYDAATNGNELWAVINQSVATDANGIYDVILSGLNLTFADQYYLGIAVQGENESAPRINLTSTPYSFRANTSEALNPNASFVVRNLSITGNATIGDGTTTLAISTQGFNLTTAGSINLANNLSLGDKITFRLGNFIDNLVSGFLRINGNFNATGNTTIANTLFVDNTSRRVGIRTTTPTHDLEIVGADNARIALDATNGNDPQIVFREAANTRFVLGVDGDDADKFKISTGSLGSGDRFIIDQSGNVGIGTAAPTKLLSVNGTLNAITFDPSASPNSVMNTTGNNLTISSAAGSVIIRLG